MKVDKSILLTVILGVVLAGIVTGFVIPKIKELMSPDEFEEED